MPRVEELRPEELYRRCETERLEFETTDELVGPDEVVGQPRALEALEFGVSISRKGYNIFAFGAADTGKRSLVQELLRRRAADGPPACDDCYVHDFVDANRPKLLRLPAGRGAELRRDMERLVDELRSVLRSAFETDHYQTRRQIIEAAFQERQERALSQLGEDAEQQGLALVRTPLGIVFAPARDDDVLSPEEFGKLPKADQEHLQQEIERFEEKLQKTVRQFPSWQRETRDKLRELNREVSRTAVDPLFEELRHKYEKLPEVLAHLDAVRGDVIVHARGFTAKGEEAADKGARRPVEGQALDQPFLRRYRVNLLVDRTGSESAPVVYEDNPSLPNLLGRIEHVQHMGGLVTDFNLIKAGALHRANGGYLLLDALRLLQQPHAWESLKRALQSSEIKIESMGQLLSLVSTYSIEPEPVPLGVKVVLLGEPWIYYLLSVAEPDFRKLFKVAADFDDRMQRDADAEMRYARLLAKLARDEKLLPLTREAVGRVIEHGARSLGDADRLSLALARVLDLLREADHWARQAERQRVDRDDVERAIRSHERRSDRLRERVQEEMLRGTILIETAGSEVGQVNGLSVTQLGDFAFGRPSRITARVRLGKGEVVDIEREVELSGPIHAKGVLILSGFLGARYAARRPLSLSASLVFEQSYSGVEGDSASSAELYALLSAIAELPMKQSLAVTGSVNQHGQIQPVGGINEKIEGFFDLCTERGLNGEQGVLIPRPNVRHLMLRRDVVEAVEAGRFHIYPVASVDQGMELLSGIESGSRDAEGVYPAGSVNRRVEDRLAELARAAQEFSRPAAAGSPADAPGSGEAGG